MPQLIPYFFNQTKFFLIINILHIYTIIQILIFELNTNSKSASFQISE